jgi:hypothetical protein
MNTTAILLGGGDNAQAAVSMDDPGVQGGIAAAGIIAAVVVAGVAAAVIKAKNPTKRAQRKQSRPTTSSDETIDNPIANYDTVATASIPIAGSALMSRIPLDAARIATKPTLPRNPAPISNAAQARLQVARNAIPSSLPGTAKSTMTANALKQFETYDRSHFQAQRIRQQSRGPAVRNPNQPRVSITQIVQNTYSQSGSEPTNITNPIRGKVEFGAQRIK